MHNNSDKQCQAQMVQMTDGVKLSTYVRLPGEGESWPVIVARSPYPQALQAWLERAKYWAGLGYAFVYQECRGTGRSEGEWEPFVHESQDGLDTLEWVIRQEWSNGNIGTYGASYSGTLQWCIADRLPPEVKTMYISVAGIERYKQSYMNGMFRHDIYTVWVLGNSGYSPLRPGPGLYREALSVRPHKEMDLRIFGHRLPWYRDWIDHADSGHDYWSTGFWAELSEKPRRVRVPVMMVAGWFDHNLEASVLSYNKLPDGIRRQSCFIIGPWVHHLGVSGDLDYPGHEAWGPQQDHAALVWFDHHLKHKPLDGLPGTVRTYAVREGAWKSWEGWIRSDRMNRYYLSVSEDGDGLTLKKPGGSGVVSYDYDPDHPVPTRGGSALMAYLSGSPEASPPASVIQEKPGTREDIVSLLSAELREDLRIAGRMKVYLYVSSDAEDTSFTVCVMEQCEDGTAYNIRDGITSLSYRNNAATPCRYKPHEIVEAVIDLWPITWTVKKGSRLRIDISSSNFPAYHVHLNRSGPWAMQQEAIVARQTIYSGGLYPSRIELPTVNE